MRPHTFECVVFVIGLNATLLTSAEQVGNGGTGLKYITNSTVGISNNSRAHNSVTQNQHIRRIRSPGLDFLTSPPVHFRWQSTFHTALGALSSEMEAQHQEEDFRPPSTLIAKRICILYWCVCGCVQVLSFKRTQRRLGRNVRFAATNIQVRHHFSDIIYNETDKLKKKTH